MSIYYSTAFIVSTIILILTFNLVITLPKNFKTMISAQSGNFISLINQKYYVIIDRIVRDLLDMVLIY